jgi:hypothetical protein
MKYRTYGMVEREMITENSFVVSVTRREKRRKINL